MNKYSIFLEPVTQKEIHDIIKSLKDGLLDMMKSLLI